MFARKATADFEASTLFPLDELASCRVWMDQATTGLGDDWHLERVAVAHLPSNRTWLFMLNNWVPKEGAVMAAQVRGGRGEGRGRLPPMHAPFPLCPTVQGT
jgi:hypothetical protein